MGKEGSREEKRFKRGESEGERGDAVAGSTDYVFAVAACSNNQYSARRILGGSGRASKTLDAPLVQ